MGIASILSYGTAGLGFLLATLSYRLMINNRTNEHPPSAFMLFCTVLVIIAAVSHYVSDKQTLLLEQAQKDKLSAEEKLNITQGQLSISRDQLFTVQETLLSTQSSLATVTALSMREKKALEMISGRSPSVITSLTRTSQECIRGCDGRGGGVLDIATQAASAISEFKAAADSASSAP